jgi:hypothetical protein
MFQNSSNNVFIFNYYKQVGIWTCTCQFTAWIVVSWKHGLFRLKLGLAHYLLVIQNSKGFIELCYSNDYFNNK